MRKNKLIRIGALLLSAVCLAGCTSKSAAAPIAQPETQNLSDSTTERIPTVAATTSRKPSAIAEPTHVEEVIDENFSIDADIVGTPENGMAGVYVGEPVRFTKEEIQRFIETCGTMIVSTQESSTPDKEYYNGVCENGAVFYAEHDAHNHPYSKFIYRNDEKCEFYRAYPIYSGEKYYLTDAQYTVGWMFDEPKQLSFASSKDAETSVRAALETLGLTDLKLLRTLYCDHHTLEAAMQRITTHGDYAPLGPKVENNGYPIRESWSAEDDAYVFSFGFSVSDIPMSYSHHRSSRTAWYTGSEIVVWYTKDGIVNLVINTPWHIKEVESAPEPIVSAEIALDVATTKFGYDLMKKDKCIEEIRLEYHYVQDKSRWLLIPVWSVACSSRNSQDDGKMYNYIYINALTGDEL